MTTSWNTRTRIGNTVIDVVYNGYWNDSGTWNDSLLWVDEGGLTSFTSRTIPTTNWNGRTQLLDYNFDADIDFDADIGFDGDKTLFTKRIIP